MFDWIPADSVWFWIWFVGFLPMSVITFFAWILNCTLLGDSMDKWYRRRMFVWYTFLGFVSTWLWPIGLLGFCTFTYVEREKQRRWDKKWAEKKATVPNYWRDVYLILNGQVTDIQCRVLDWDYYNGDARLALWRGDSRFFGHKGTEVIVYWPNKDLEFIPEKVAKV